MIELDTIYNENCLETLKRMDDESIDMVLTSPPYDDLRNYKGYSFPFEEIATELARVLKKGGVIIWVVNDATKNGNRSLTSFKQALFFQSLGLNVNDVMIYVKHQFLPRIGKRYQNNFEFMFCFTKGQPKTFNPILIPCRYATESTNTAMGNRNKDGSYTRKTRSVKPFKPHTSIFEYYTTSFMTKDKIAYKHPAIFPEKLATDQINTWTNEGDIVYDPFLGSGTTAKMAKISGRHYIGSEISDEYVAIANERLGLL